MSIETAFTVFPAIKTERLLLRQIQLSDAEALFEIFSDREAMKYYGHEAHTSIEETQNLVKQLQERYLRKDAIRWGVTFHGDDKVIGTCSFHHFGADNRRVETGYDLNQDFWGKGVMKEAMSAVLSFGFMDLGFHRVEAIIDILNERSKGLLLKLGFTYEGNLRQRYPFGDTFLDEHYFGLLKDEWLTKGSSRNIE